MSMEQRVMVALDKSEKQITVEFKISPIVQDTKVHTERKPGRFEDQ